MPAGPEIIVEGRTEDFVFVHVSKHFDGTFYIQVDGKEVEQTRVHDLLRDGGTRTWHTTAGKITKRNLLGLRGDWDRRAFFNGDVIHEDKGYDFKAAERLARVGDAAREAIVRHRPMPTEPLREHEIVTNNVHAVTQDILRAAIHAGVVVPKTETDLWHLANAGSASHDDTPRTLREAAGREPK